MSSPAIITADATSQCVGYGDDDRLSYKYKTRSSNPLQDQAVVGSVRSDFARLAMHSIQPDHHESANFRSVEKQVYDLKSQETEKRFLKSAQTHFQNQTISAQVYT